MSEKFGVKVEDIFNTMEERFRPEGAEGVDASFGYDIQGRGKWKLTVKDQAMTIEQAEDLGDCVVITKADPDTFVGVNIGKVDGTEAFTAGKIAVEGDMGAMGMTFKLFKRFSPPQKELTVGEYIQDMFGTLEARFQPEAAGDDSLSIGYDIDGDDGGQWTAVIGGGKCALQEGIVGTPTLTLAVKAKDWVDLMLGRVDALTLMSTGRAKLDGDMAIAMRLGELFAKYAPPGQELEEDEELLVLKKVISVEQKFATGPIMGKYLNGLKEKKIYANRCPVCNRTQIPPREACAVCHVRSGEFVEVGPKGNVRLLDTAYYASPDPLTGETRETPYAMAYILLDGCKGQEVFAHFIRDDQLDRIEMGWNEKKGTIVRPVWADERSGKVSDIKYYEIDE